MGKREPKEAKKDEGKKEVSRKDQSKSTKRRDIRDAAYACFRRQGYAQTTVDSICQEAGISKGSLYWHYPSKQDVFVDIIEVWTREVMDELYEQFEDAVLEENFHASVSAALKREVHRGRAVVPLWLEFSVLGRHEPEIQQALAKFYRRARSATAEVLRPLMASQFSEEEIRGAAAVCFGGYLGMILQEMSDPDRIDAIDEIVDFMAVFAKVLNISGR